MSSRTIVRALHRTLTVMLVVAICASQVSLAVAGNYRIGAVGGVMIQSDGVVRNATVDQRAALAKLRREEFQKPKKKRLSRDELLVLRQDVRRCEDRVDKINEMRDKIASKLADPTIYDNPAKAAEWQKKYSEAMDGLERAEGLWMTALDKLEKAEAK